MMAPARSPVDAEQLQYLYRTNFARRLDELADDIHRRLMNKLIAQGHHGLKMSFSAVLSHLGFAETRLVDIAERAGMSKQAIGQIADEIEALGYIRRVPDRNDRRAKNVVFTPRGEELIACSLQAMEEVEQELTATLGQEVFHQFKMTIERLTQQTRTT